VVEEWDIIRPTTTGTWKKTVYPANKKF
jgi:hypothetical protein